LAAINVAKSRLKGGNSGSEAAHQLIDDSKDILAQALDDQVRQTNFHCLCRSFRLFFQYHSTVTDPAISRSLASYWEGQFFHDMARLRVRDPDTLTRVTEYVPENVAFVEGIIRNGYAYEVQGSVYFDTQAFDKADDHHYAKLEPWSKGNRELLEEGEGMVTLADNAATNGDAVTFKVRYRARLQVVDPHPTSRFGKHQSPESLRGLRRGALGDLDGILSVLSWPAPSSAITWIFIPAVLTWHFPITIMS
jgi:cysteinyl-tRNA synthetase